MNKKKPRSLEVRAKITKEGIDIILNGDHFKVIYPTEIWEKYDKTLKRVLAENIAYSSTIFIPQMFDLHEINYKTARPISETFLFKNGIYDMPICAITDNKSSLDYVKKFFNTRPIYEKNEISVPPQRETKKKTQKTAIVPFSFGKESMLSFSLCKEIGINPILVNFIEPSNKYEYFHKRKLIEKFEKEMKVKVYTVKYNPGILRYGKHWNLNTELGWGLQTTEYALMSLPFAEYFNADYIVLGNEQSCNDIFFDKEGMMSYKAAYDQHSDWTPQQGLLASLILGRKIEVVSFMESLYEIAINKILHQRYPEDGKYQMSCMADNKNAKNNRWCQKCVKCGYIYALCCAFNLDLKKIGFTKNLFDKEHSKIYDHFFNYDPKAPAYGSQKELGLAFYLSFLNGFKGHSIEKFKKTLLPRFQKNKKAYAKQYLGINKHPNIPAKYKKSLLKIYKEELNLNI